MVAFPKQGFTIMELMIVVVLILSAAALANNFIRQTVKSNHQKPNSWPNSYQETSSILYGK